MNIQERKNKEGKITSYRIRVFDHRDAQTGKQVFRTLSVKYDDTKSAAWNKKNAEKQAVIFEKGIEEQTASDSRVTFDEYCDYAIKIKEQSSISPSTAYSYRYSKRRIAPYLGHIQLKKMTPAMINESYSKMLESGLSRNSVYAMHLFVHAMLAMAFKEGLIPATTLMPQRHQRKSKPRSMHFRKNSLICSLNCYTKTHRFMVIPFKCFSVCCSQQAVVSESYVHYLGIT